MMSILRKICGIQEAKPQPLIVDYRFNFMDEWVATVWINGNEVTGYGGTKAEALDCVMRKLERHKADFKSPNNETVWIAR